MSMQEFDNGNSNDNGNSGKYDVKVIGNSTVYTKDLGKS